MILRRTVFNKLIEWQHDPERKPLILKGARQVGKTWLMKEFGKCNYTDYAYFNFDEEAALKSIFQTNKNPHRLMELLSMITGKIIGLRFVVLKR